MERKAEWPDPVKAARQNAGHANAARGEDVLWIVGLDENRGVFGARGGDLADRWPRVASRCESAIPQLLHDRAVHTAEGDLVALLFASDLAPYLVKNPAFNVHPGPVEYEVPWREGSRKRRSAAS